PRRNEPRKGSCALSLGVPESFRCPTHCRRIEGEAVRQAGRRRSRGRGAARSNPAVARESESRTSRASSSSFPPVPPPWRLHVPRGQEVLAPCVPWSPQRPPLAKEVEPAVAGPSRRPPPRPKQSFNSGCRCHPSCTKG